ncbi:protein ITPRID1 [Pteronotus mesoamericanus]|uniref:protein ITPRID1 n=1 Tax=Pteronotus mesoamericanus TaxID=1884717 RepID=UPI0023EAD812|nr:protein ITPRID1 [Pteronotus parnellii mesoamericanus]
MRMEMSHGSDSPPGGQERRKRDILRSTKRAWVPLDEQLPPGPAGPTLEDSKQESIQQWLDSGFFVSVKDNFQQASEHAAFLPEQGKAHMTVQDYMRSLHQFPETPTLTRGTSFNSCHSATSIPQSIPEWLEFWENDPVEILLDLGFGADEPDICTQIPARFLGCSSAARGINIHVFLEAQKQRMDIENPDLYGRFQQLEILDHVANAFSSLLNEVNTLQSKAKEEDGEESVHRTSVGGANEHQRRTSELLRRASRRNIRGDCSSKVSESLKNREEFSLPSTKPGAREAQLSAVMDNLQQVYLSSSAEHLSLQDCDDLIPCHPPQPLLKKQWPSSPVLNKQAPPSCMPKGPVKDRAPKEHWIQTNKLKSLADVSGAPDSFEMEEVQSFEEEIGNPPDLTSGTVGAMVSRANSCQSDSSGFLEELPEPPALQVPSLPAGPSPAEDGCRRPGGQSQRLAPAQHGQRDSEESDSKSGTSMSFSSQDWSVLEEKSSTSVVEAESHLEATEGQPGLSTSDVALSRASGGGEHRGKDGHQRQPPPVPHTQHEADISTTPCPYDLEFTVTHVTEGRSGFLRPGGTGDTHVQSHLWEPQTSLDMDHARDKSLHVGPEAPRGAECGEPCPDFHHRAQTGESPPEPVPKSSKAGPSAANLIHTSEKAVPHREKVPKGATPHVKPRYGAAGPKPPRAEPELGALPPRTGSSSGRPESVTVQRPSRLVSAAQSAVALGPYSRRTTLERTVGDPAATTEPVLGTEARQFHDVSVQTDLWEARSWHCYSVPSSKAQPWTKSISLDAGLPSSCSVHTCHAVPAHCWGCSRHHPHCHPGGQSPSPVPLACSCGLCSHSHREEQFSKTLEVLRDPAVRELCSCTAYEMDAMKMLCRGFREHLEEIEQHLTGQQALFSGDMSEEERKEAEHLQALRKALRQQVEELEFQLGDRAQQIRGGILLQLELLAGEPPENRTNPHQYDWTEDKKGQTPAAQARPAVALGAALPADSSQWASCPGITRVAACPPLTWESHARMSPPAQEELGSALVSTCPIGEKDTDVSL